ncbi:MAG: hypothetical protein CEE41_01700 [Hadesarchaea archaeon B3_Hades]|nr:MAG: hypothetical protein CEE41_01700 [Hadesarchaea archaeon B3_Hades]
MTGWARSGDPPDYVLLYEGQQIGAMHGSLSSISQIEIFESHTKKGHGAKFVELIEQESKRQGIKKIVYDPVTNPMLGRILKKLGYTQESELRYVKKDCL